MYRMWLGMASVAVVSVTIGFGLGSASGQQAPPSVDIKVLGTVAAGDNCPDHVLRMRRITFPPGSSIAMHDHKDHPEVSLVVDGTLTNTLKGKPPIQLATGSPVLNGTDVEHLPANTSDKTVVVLSVDLIKK